MIGEEMNMSNPESGWHTRTRKTVYMEGYQPKEEVVKKHREPTLSEKCLMIIWKLLAVIAIELLCIIFILV